MGASIRHQACRDWFYGRDGRAEHALGRIEGAASALLRRLLETGRPPFRYSEEHRLLATFVLVQSARTAQAATQADEMADRLGKVLLRNSLRDPELLAALDDLTLRLTEPAAEALRPAVLETPVILDLKVKLLRNVSPTPFVMGDHPVVKHNGLYRAAAVSVLGLANVGLQFVMPISPEWAIVLYDEAAYSLGHLADPVVSLSSSAAVSALNEFQWADALENVYFRPGKDPKPWLPDPDRLRELRRDDHVWVGESDVHVRDGKRAKLVSIQARRPSRVLQLPLFRNRISPPPLPDVGTLPLRDPEWAFHVHRMRDALDARTISPEEFHVRTTPPRFMERSIRDAVAARTARRA